MAGQGQLSIPLLVFLWAFLAATAAAWIWAIHRIRRKEPLFPRSSLPAVPWAEGSILAILILWVAWSTVAWGLVRPWTWSLSVAPRGARSPSAPLSDFEKMLLMAYINAGMLVLVPSALKVLAGARPEHFGLAGGRALRCAASGLLACLMLTPAVYAINYLAILLWPASDHPLEVLVRSDPSGRTTVLAIVSAVILAPAAEELVFRGVILGWLSRRFRVLEDRGPIDGVAAITYPTPRWRCLSTTFLPNVMTSLIFAAIHTRWPDPLAIFVLALGLGWLYQRTGCLLAPMAMHATFNGLSTLALFAGVAGGE